MEKALSCTSSFVAGLSLCPLVVYLYFAFGKPSLIPPTRPFPLKRRSLRFPSRRESKESCQVFLRSSLTMRRSLGVRKSCRTNVQSCHRTPGVPPATGKQCFQGTATLGESQEWRGRSEWRSRGRDLLEGEERDSAVRYSSL